MLNDILMLALSNGGNFTRNALHLPLLLRCVGHYFDRNPLRLSFVLWFTNIDCSVSPEMNRIKRYRKRKKNKRKARHGVNVGRESREGVPRANVYDELVAIFWA